ATDSRRPAPDTQRRPLRHAAGDRRRAVCGDRTHARSSWRHPMMKKFGLRFRINLVITLVIVIFALAASDVLIEETRRSIREEVEAGTKVTVQLMETVIANTRADAQSGPHNQALLSFLRHLGRVRANEIRMYDDNDQLIYTSPPSQYKQ